MKKPIRTALAVTATVLLSAFAACSSAPESRPEDAATTPPPFASAPAVPQYESEPAAPGYLGASSSGLSH